MSYKLNTGHLIPLVGLGTSKADGDDLFGAVGVALTAGYRLFDSAAVYGNHTILGEALAHHLKEQRIDRSDVFIATKVYLTKENTMENVLKSVHKCLHELNLNYIDLIMIHYPTYDSSNPEAAKDENNKEIRIAGYQALINMKKDGLIRSVGVSNYEIKHIQEIEDAKLPLPAVNQIEIHPHFVRKELRDYCTQKGVFVQAFASLASRNEDLLKSDVVTKIATRLNTSSTAILLAYAHSQNIGIIPKSVNANRIQQNYKDASITLTPEDIAQLDTLDRNTDGCYVKRCKGWTVV